MVAEANLLLIAYVKTNLYFFQLGGGSPFFKMGFTDLMTPPPPSWIHTMILYTRNDIQYRFFFIYLSLFLDKKINC